MSEFHVIIPARIGSTRLPRKALLDIGGLPMVVRVARRVAEGKQAPQSITVATDDAEIRAVCAAHDVACVMTSTAHISGTDRVAEAARLLGLGQEAIIVNVQGDEPLIPPAMVAAVAGALDRDREVKVATAAHPITEAALVFNPNVVKVVLDQRQHALYFSRAAIPWHRDSYPNAGAALPTVIAPQVLRHYGLYAFRMTTLQDFIGLPASDLEQVEALEQLRFLAHQYPIVVHISPDHPEAGVDTLADWERVQRYFAQAVPKNS